MIDIEKLKNMKEALTIIGFEENEIKGKLEKEFLLVPEPKKYLSMPEIVQSEEVITLLREANVKGCFDMWNTQRRRKSGMVWYILRCNGVVDENRTLLRTNIEGIEGVSSLKFSIKYIKETISSFIQEM